jgi:CCR4-NOT transcription complex subunit 7/8
MDSGINFDKLSAEGIEYSSFAETLISSGLIMNSDIHWYGFHTDHDFAYLLRLLTAQPIASSETQFLSDLSLIFPNFYDVKEIADMSMGGYRGGLASLCENLGVYREDDCAHQAGSDSKITAKAFFALKKFGEASIESCKGDIYGLSKTDKNTFLPTIGGSSHKSESSHCHSRKFSMESD